MARKRRQMGLPGGCSNFTFTVPNGAGPSTILLPVIVPNDTAYVVSIAVGVNTAGTGGATANIKLRDGSTDLLQAPLVLGANTDAAGTYEGSAEGNLTRIPEGDQLSIVWTLVAGTNTTGAVYNVQIVWGF